MRLEVSECKYVYVDSAAEYSGYPSIAVEEGEQYTFKVNPLCKWKRKKISFGANGTVIPFVSKKDRRLPNVRYHSLCAVIDRCYETSFKVGSYLSEQNVEASGPLSFFANKSIEDSEEGSGYLIVEVIRNK